MFLKLAYASAQGSDIEADQATPAGDVCIMLSLCCCLFTYIIHLGNKDRKKMEAYELLVSWYTRHSYKICMVGHI